MLTELYNFLIDLHNIEGYISFDGGSDSLMKGDEIGLGDPIEDQVTIASINNLDKINEKMLVVIGYGSDKFNGVTNEDSMKAISEITKRNGFLGTFSLIKDSDEYNFYKDLISLIQNQSFKSIISCNILSSAEGDYGSDIRSPFILENKRLDPSDLNINILYSILFFFDIEKVAERSLVIPIIKNCETVIDCEIQLKEFRRSLCKI